MAKDTSISFERPPVIETVLGVQFGRILGFTNAHLGSFWKSVGSEWPYVDFVPQLEDQFETFGEAPAWSGLQLRLTQSPMVRLQIKNVSGDRMIQVQNGRLHYNWLGREEQAYPRYSSVRREFDKVLERFRGFLGEQELGPMKPNQWEVTYVNHIPKGTVWDEPQDWHQLFGRLPGPCISSENTRLEGFGGHWHFEIAPQRGRLHVEIKHGHLGSPTGQEALTVTLTARGPVSVDEPSGFTLAQGLDVGHEVIVKAFANLTSSEAREYWGEIS